MKSIFKELLHLQLPLILASGSPRRKSLLQSMGLEFEVIVSDFDEDAIEFTNPVDYCEKLARSKAESVLNLTEYPTIIIAADTIVYLEDKVLNKPRTELEALEMLTQLSGNTHSVFTAVAVANTANDTILVKHKETKVTFRNLRQIEIESYIATGSPMDKAGAYGIQDDFGATFVSSIEGDFYNVVGLPLELLYSMLGEI